MGFKQPRNHMFSGLKIQPREAPFFSRNAALYFQSERRSHAAGHKRRRLCLSYRIYSLFYEWGSPTVSKLLAKRWPLCGWSTNNGGNHGTTFTGTQSPIRPMPLAPASLGVALYSCILLANLRMSVLLLTLSLQARRACEADISHAAIKLNPLHPGKVVPLPSLSRQKYILTYRQPKPHEVIGSSVYVSKAIANSILLNLRKCHFNPAA